MTPVKDHQHGTITGYAYGCRCEECLQGARAVRAARKRRGLSSEDPRHGTYNGYNTYGCRCDPCTDANAERHRRAHLERDILPPDDPRHGTINGYENWDCRCDPCLAAKSLKNRQEYESGRYVCEKAAWAMTDPHPATEDIVSALEESYAPKVERNAPARCLVCGLRHALGWGPRTCPMEVT